MQTLTTAIETVPPQGVLNPNDTVSGVVSAAVAGVNTSTFQTGDTINGWNVPGTANNNVVSILDASTNLAGTVASVNNVARINHTLLATNAYNEALYVNVGQEWVTSGAGGNALIVNNANAATTYGLSSGTTDGLALTYAGATGQTANIALANAGLIPTTGASTPSAINVAGGANISTVKITSSGKNDVTVNGGATLTNVTVTGAGTNKVSVGVIGSTAASGVTLDVSAATGKNTLDLGANYAAISTIAGTTGASETVVSETLTTASSPTGWTNVDTLKFNNGSNGGTFIGSGNTSITKIIQADKTVSDNTTVNGLQGVTALTYEGTKTDANQTFSGITFVGSLSAASNALAVSFDNGGVALAAGRTLQVGDATHQTILTGAENVTFDFSNGVGSTGAVSFGAAGGGITDTTLQTLVLKNVGTGAVDIGTVVGGATTITSVDASGVAGNFKAIFDAAGLNNGLANGAAILGSAKANDLSFDDTTLASSVSLTLNGTGTQKVYNTFAALPLANESFTINGGNGDFIINKTGVAGALFPNTVALTNASSTVTLGNGNDFVVLGNGNDVISVGTGTNVVAAGAGANIITLNSASGGSDLVNFNNNFIVSGGSDVITGYVTSTDSLGVSAATNVLGLSNAGVAVVLVDQTASAANFGLAAAAQAVNTNGDVFVVANAALNTALTTTSTLADVASNFATAAAANKFLLSSNAVLGTGTFILDATSATANGTDLLFQVATTNGVVTSVALVGQVSHTDTQTTFADFA